MLLGRALEGLPILDLNSGGIGKMRWATGPMIAGCECHRCSNQRSCFTSLGMVVGVTTQL